MASRDFNKINQRRVLTILSDGCLHRAREIAEELGVSERTIYRLVVKLRDRGFQIMGEAGVGYIVWGERNEG